jgi:hypothetical protein
MFFSAMIQRAPIAATDMGTADERREMAVQQSSAPISGCRLDHADGFSLQESLGIFDDVAVENLIPFHRSARIRFRGFTDTSTGTAYSSP